ATSIEPPPVVHDIEFAVVAFPERRDAEAGIEAARYRQRGLRAFRDVEDPVGDEVAEDVSADKWSDHRTPIDMTACDAVSDAAAVLRDRRQKVRRRSAGEPGVARALEAAPSIIATERHPVDFLDRVLADIRDPELPCQPVEAPSPRIAETVGIDLGAALHVCSGSAFRIGGKRIG